MTIKNTAIVFLLRELIELLLLTFLCETWIKIEMKILFTVFKNTAFGLIAQVAIKILSFLFSIFIIRDLGAESYGQYVAILAFGAIFTVLSDLGLSPYAVREIARYRGEKGNEIEISRLYTNILSLRFLLSILTALVIIMSAWATRRPSVMIIAIAINTIGLILYSIQGTAETVLSGHEVFGVTASAKITQQLFFVILGGIFLYLGFGFFGLIYANLLGILVLTFVCLRGMRKLDVNFLGYDTRSWGKLVRSGLPFGLIGFALGLSYKFDTVLLNIFRGDLETGYYNAAYNLVFSAVVLSNVVNTALYPSLSRQAITDPAHLHSIYARMIKYLLLISLPIAFGVSTLSNQIVEFLYTSDYAFSSQALRIVIWVLPFMYLSEFLGYAVVIGNNERKVARAVLISTAFNLLLNLLLVPQYGYLAAAIMTVLTEAILVFQHVFTMKIVIRKMNLGMIVFRLLLATSIMAIFIFFLQNHIPLLFNIGIGSLLYLALLILFRIIGNDEYHTVREIISRAKARILA